MNLREAVWALVKDMIVVNSRIGTAENIDVDKGLCDVKLGEDLYLYNVRLKAIESDLKEGVTEIPVKDSMVVAMMLEGVDTQWVIVKCSKVEKWTIQTDGGAKAEFNKDGEVLLNGNGNKGLVILDKAKENFDTLKSYCEQMKSAVSAALQAVGESTAASGSKGKAEFETAMASASINFSDMENKKVKHGE